MHCRSQVCDLKKSSLTVSGSTLLQSTKLWAGTGENTRIDISSIVASEKLVYRTSQPRSQKAHQVVQHPSKAKKAHTPSSVSGSTTGTKDTQVDFT